MPITHFGSVAVPVDGVSATNATTQITITPPVSMAAGDLVLVAVHQRGTATFSVGVTGGQAWNALTRRTNTNIAVQFFWAVFNGTWDANPRFDLSAGTCSSAVMHVFRPSSSGMTFGIDQGEASSTFAAPTTPFTVTRAGVVNAQASTVTIAGFFTADDNTWGTLSGSGWSQSGMSAQYRNTSGTDQSSSFAYKIQTSAGDTGSVSMNQASLGGDAGLTTVVSFYELQELDAPLIQNTNNFFSPTVANASVATWVKHPDVPGIAVNVYGYWQFTPVGADENTPLLVFWHGSGEQGGGNSTDLDKLTTQSLPKLINDRMGTPDEFPHHCIVICPQYVGTPLGGFAFQNVLNWIKTNIVFDHTKLHLAGYSLGGACIANWWDVGTLEDVASCYLIAPSLTYYTNAGSRLAASGMPILFSHGDGDTGFTAYSNSTGWVNNLTTDGVLPTPLLDTLEGQGHNIDEIVHDWTNYYPVSGGQDAVEWQLQFQRVMGLEVPLIPSSSNVYAPTVVGGDLSMQAPLVSNTNQFFAPTVSVQSFDWAQVGSSAAVTNLASPRMAALSSTRVVIWNNGTGNKRFEVWDFDGTSWTLTATLAAGTLNNACVARVTATRFATYDENLARMRVYNISGSTISTVGNFLDLAGPGSPRALGLGENQWIITDNFSSSLRVFSFDGTNITQVGSEFASAGGANSAMARLTDTRIALYDQTSGNRYRILDWSGTAFNVYATIGSQNSDIRSMAGLASNKFAVFNDTTDVLSVLQLDGTSLIDAGINLTLSGSTASAIGGLSASRIAWVDDTNDSLRTYDFDSGPAAQSLTVSLFSNTNSFYDPTVTGGAASISVPLLSNSNSFFAATVTGGATPLTVPLLSNTNTFYAATVTGGAQGQYSSGVVQSGLVLALDAANPSSYPGSGTAWGNLNGGDFDANLDAGVTFDAADKRSLVFGSGATGNITPAQFPGLPVGAAPRTVNVLVKLSSTTPTYQWAFAYGDTSNNYKAFFLGAANNTGGFAGAIADGAFSSGFWTAGQWTMMTAVYNGSQLSLYKNGVAVVSNYSIPLDTTNLAILIGRQLDPYGTEVWGGKIRAIQVYDRALSLSEIEQNYNYLTSEPLFVPTLTNSNQFFGATVSAGGASTQNLTATRVEDGDAVYAPVVTPGQVNVTSPIVNNTNQFFGPTVSTSYGVTAPVVSNTNQFFAPVVTPGQVSLVVPVVNNANQFFASTVSAGSLSVSVPVVSNTNQFFGATVTPGATTVTVPVVSNTNQFFAATVSAGQISVAVPIINNVNQFFPVSVQASSVNVTAPIVNNVNSFFSHIISSGEVNVAAPFFENQSAFFLHNVNAGAISVALLRIESTSIVFGGHNLSSSVQVSSAFIPSSNGVFPPAVTRGPVSLSVQRFDNTSQIFQAAIALNGSLVVSRVDNENDFYGHVLYMPVTGGKRYFKAKIIS